MADEDSAPVTSVREHLTMLTIANEEFRSENKRLKWIIGQLLRRMKKDHVILYMVATSGFGINIEENPTRREIHIRLKEHLKEDDKVPDSDGESSLN